MLKPFFTLFLLIFSINGFAADNPAKKSTENPIVTTFIEGKHYQRLTPPLPQMAAPIVEFMYFGCETCYKLAPAIAEWSYTKKIDVALVPVHSESAMVEEARIFHALKLIGALEEMYEEGFILVQTKESKLQGADRINEALNRHGVDKNKFWEMWKSDAIKQRLASSAALTKQAQITKTPTFIVHGTYRVDITSVKSVEELFLLLEYLVAKKVTTVPTSLKKPA